MPKETLVGAAKDQTANLPVSNLPVKPLPLTSYDYRIILHNKTNTIFLNAYPLIG